MSDILSPASDPHSRRPTIRDVARLAGLSAMTVSRAITGTGYVSESSRAKVDAAVAEAGYTPNQVARSLRSARTGTIGLVLTDITNPFFTTIARAVEDEASANGQLVLLCNTDESEDEERKYLKLLVEKCVDGILLVPALDGSESVSLAARHKIPVVILDRRSSAEADIVRSDSFTGSRDLAGYLLDLGHKNFAVLAGPKGVSTSDDRVSGFKSRLGEENAARTPVFYGQFNQRCGHELASRILAERPETTAIFAVNNFLLIGAMQELSERGIAVPSSISLAGFDDLPPAMVASPFLTVVSQPAYEIGQLAVQRLMSRLAGTGDPEFTESVLETTVIRRGSCGIPRVD